MTNLDLARRYVSLVANQTSTFEQIREIYADELEWREMPNLFAPNGRTTTLAGVAEAWRKGREAVIDQVYDIRNAIADGDTVVLEISWQGRMNNTLRPLHRGTRLRA